MIDRFDGWISGLGTQEGRRIVVGHWPRSPLGSFTDVMTEDAGGTRTLLAPSGDVAAFVSATYTFDEVRVVPVTHTVRGDRRQVVAGPLEVAWRVGPRPPLGLLLAAVPGPVAVNRYWLRAIDPLARRVQPGVRTVGSAGGGRREYYGARDLHRIAAAVVRWDGVDLGGLAPVVPAVRFGFGSAPACPSHVRITTLVERALT
ncbi:hypothetical protein AD006_22005 [Pseudonocardia sp. EC080610-09]|uniref:hypothetical protein n=1 Tax=unclassified Pseudonocardia TaxID=2619320 RepID=UPI0006CB4028|nr:MULTISPECIES: hypothetical protein [unclassified Pseudonocardia]ALE73923.1 hypothetical protein FRP1_14340 [Pseudonocardia sp. EC080625-04]ALL77316.1 hypothetical protein AD006_22005 [Pseudonocardia sp. EC080610-09]ALL80232.1 hypothetical protein AD017_01590 [Pseudonocardia sp. EC080619-01]